jgi:hypothetical protein
VPDRGGQREDAGEDALGSLAAVAFQVKLPLEGPVGGLDDLAQRLEQVLPSAPGIALADRPQQCRWLLLLLSPFAVSPMQEFAT